MREARRYLGLELAGAKNQKTALAVIEHYPKERKVFLLDLFDKVGSDIQSGDEALLGLIGEVSQGVARVGVNVPLELPPCIGCSRRTCPMPAHCSVPAVKWMRQQTKRHKGPDFTPYTQRPFELWVRYEILPQLPPWARFEIDEALGGTKAPLTARANFLRRHLGFPVTEVWPKLTIAILGVQLGIQKRTLQTYRHLEQGVHAREEFLEALTAAHDVFVYERDIRKLAASLPAFDAFVCAYTALLADTHRCSKMPAGFPATTGWAGYPEIP